MFFSIIEHHNNVKISFSLVFDSQKTWFEVTWEMVGNTKLRILCHIIYICNWFLWFIYSGYMLGYQYKVVGSKPYFHLSWLNHVILLLKFMPHECIELITLWSWNLWHSYVN